MRSGMKVVFIAVLAGVTASTRDSEIHDCPRTCHCYKTSDNDGTYVDCSSRKLKEIPDT